MAWTRRCLNGLDFRRGPQFLVDRLGDSLAFYEQSLGFERDFVYEDFYASGSRDGAANTIGIEGSFVAERVRLSSRVEI